MELSPGSAVAGVRAFGGPVATARASQTITRSSYSSSVLGNKPDRSSRLDAERGEQQSMSMGAATRGAAVCWRSGRTNATGGGIAGP